MFSSFFPSARVLSVCISAIAFGAGLGAARAQMQLPGAFTPAPVGTVVTSSPEQKKPKKVAPVVLKPPVEEAIANRIMMQNGRSGVLEFRLEGKELTISKLKFFGEQIGRHDASCEVDVSPPPPLKAAGKPNGAVRYTTEAAGCALSFDVLEGATLVSTPNGTCEFKAAGCKTQPGGLWGQPASEIGPQRSKEIENARAGAERSARAQFKEWLSVAKGDKNLIARIARDQAAFSSKREEICNTYAREGQHGYCALMVTQARALALSARVPPPELPPEPADAKKKKKN